MCVRGARSPHPCCLSQRALWCALALSLLRASHSQDAGRMVETGWGNVLADQGLSLRSLPFRTVLSREMQPDTPGWASMACMLTWGKGTVPCNQSCVDQRSPLLHATQSRRASISLPGQGPCVKVLRGTTTLGCNPIDKTWKYFDRGTIAARELRSMITETEAVAQHGLTTLELECIPGFRKFKGNVTFFYQTQVQSLRKSLHGIVGESHNESRRIKRLQHPGHGAVLL